MCIEVATVRSGGIEMSKEMLIFDSLCEFMNEHNIQCVEDVILEDSIKEDCVYFVAKLVMWMLEE